MRSGHRIGAGERSIDHLTEAVERITVELKPFDAARFRAKDVREETRAEKKDAD